MFPKAMNAKKKWAGLCTTEGKAPTPAIAIAPQALHTTDMLFRLCGKSASRVELASLFLGRCACT
jgi:hypothetical protein